MRRAGVRWAIVVGIVWMMACQHEDDTSVPEPGDANGDALALAVEGKVFAATDVSADTVEGGGTHPTPVPSPTPGLVDPPWPSSATAGPARPA